MSYRFVSRLINNNNKTIGWMAYENTNPSKKSGFTLKPLGKGRYRTKKEALTIIKRK